MPTVPDEPIPLTRAQRRARERAQESAAAGTPAEPTPVTAAASENSSPSPTPASPVTPVTPAMPVSSALAPTIPAPTAEVPAQAPSAGAVPPRRPNGPARPAKAKRPRRRATFFSVFGELLITAGVLMVLFVGWQLWYNDMVERAAQNESATSLSQQWQEEFTPEQAPPASGEPPVIADPVDGVTFATLRVPRFGADYAQEIAGGVSKARTLDKIGIGHYLNTGLPGQNGNFGIAGHRNTHGAPLHEIANLRVGDALVVETREGWFTYRYRTTEYVQPSQGEVLNPLPQTDTVDTTDSIITLTSCNPKMSTAERIIAYGVFESFTPRTEAQTLPASLTDPVEG